MGLCSDLSDVSSESIPILLVALLANLLLAVRSGFLHLLRSIGFDRAGVEPEVDRTGAGFLGQVGSGLAGLIVLSEQLAVHRAFDYEEEEGEEMECVVCLCRLRAGEQVRKLACCHVFHRECLDGWFDHQNLNCPLCRTSLVPEERLGLTERRLGGELVSWFGPTAL